MRNGPPSEWVSVALLAIGADAQVCTEVEASHRLSHDSAESDQPAVLLLLPREAEGIIEQRNLVWCVPTECNSPERTPGLHAATHHSLIHYFFSSFLFDWSALVNLGFLQKAAEAFTAVPDGGVDPLWVTYTEPILCFFFLFGGIVFHFGSVWLQHSKSACQLEVAHLALAVESDYRFLGSSANGVNKKRTKK